MATYIKKTLKFIAYLILIGLVGLSVYTFAITDILKKDYVDVFGYTYFVVRTGSMSGTLEVDDIIFVKIGKKPVIGDIVSFTNKDGEIITHRLVRKAGDKLITQGDVNNTEDEPIDPDQVVGVVSGSVSPSFILKSVAMFLILFIFLSLVNFDNIIKKYIFKDKKIISNTTVPEDVFESNNKKIEKPSGLTVTIPLNELEKIQEMHDKEIVEEEEVEILEVEEVIDLNSNGIVTKERNSAKEVEVELLEQVSNLLRIKNNSLATARINKKWLTKYQYVYKLSQILLFGDTKELVESIEKPGFKEIYDYDLERAGLYENLRNKIYDMPIYVFLRILIYAVLYNDEEFFDGIFKIMKYKIQVDKNNYFREIKKNDAYAKKQLKLLINFMKKISAKFDNKNVFDLERIEKFVKLKNYVNN